MADTSSSASAPAAAAPAAPAISNAMPTPAEASKMAEQIDQAQGQTNATQAQAKAEALKKAQAAAAPKTTKKIKTKFNGREYDEELPFEIPDTQESREFMQRQMQLARLSQSKAQEQSQLQAEVVQFVQMLRENPLQALSDPRIGVDIKKMVVDFVQNEAENAKKSPDQLERERLQQELQTERERAKTERETFQRREQERMTQESMEYYDNMITSGLEKSSLPKTPASVSRIADYMYLAVKNKLPVSVEDIIPIVEEEMLGETEQLINSLSDEQVAKYFSKHVQNARKKNIQNLKAKQQTAPLKAVKDVVKQAKPKEITKDQKVAMKKFFGF